MSSFVYRRKFMPYIVKKYAILAAYAVLRLWIMWKTLCITTTRFSRGLSECSPEAQWKNRSDRHAV